MKRIIEYFILFVTGGTIYYSLECIFKSSHTSHWSMFLLAGLVFVLSGLINEVYEWDVSFILQCVVAGVFIATPLEFIFGILFNSDYSIWDYRNTIGTLYVLDSQVNIFFILLWIVLCGICIVLDDFIRWKFFGEEKPRYSIF